MLHQFYQCVATMEVLAGTPGYPYLRPPCIDPLVCPVEESPIYQVCDAVHSMLRQQSSGQWHLSRPASPYTNHESTSTMLGERLGDAVTIADTLTHRLFDAIGKRVV